MPLTTIIRSKSDPWSAVLDPKNYWFNKSLQKNLQEISFMGQITGLVIPEALAYKSLATMTTGIGATVTKEAITTGTTTGATTLGSTAGTIGLAGLIPLATTGLKTAWYLLLLDWLKKYWYIPAILLVLYIYSKKIKK